MVDKNPHGLYIDDISSPYVGLMDELQEMITVIDGSMRILNINEKFSGLISKGSGNCLGKDFWKAICHDEIPKELEITLDRMRSQRNTSTEIEVGLEGGGSKIIGLNIKQIRSNGDVEGWIIVGKDLTDRVKIAKELERVRFDLTSIFEGINESILEIRKGSIITWNQTASVKFGYPGAELLGRDISSLFNGIYPDTGSRIINTPGDMLEGTRTLKTKDGRTFTGDVHALIDNNGSGFVFIKDITSQIKKESRIRLLAEIVETTDDAVVVADGEMFITSVNKGFEEMFDLSRYALIGRNLKEIGIFNSSSRSLDEMIRKIAGGETWSGYLKFKDSKVEVERDLSMMAWPIMSSTDHGFATIFHVRDISDRLSMERNLELMSSLLSHDVKNFDRAITNNLEMLKMGVYGDLDERKASVINRILDQSRELNSLLSNARAILRSWEGENRLHPVDLRSVIHWAMDIVTRSYPESEIEIEMDLKDGPVMVLADMLLKDVFQNIFDNSFKHDPAISRISVSGERYGDGKYRVIVSDNGKGIPTQHEENTLVFLRYLHQSKFS